MKTFKLTDVQADAILNMRLRNLRKLEEMEIRSEDKELRAERKGTLKELHRSEATAMEEGRRRRSRRSATKVRAQDAARQAPHHLRPGARARRGGDRGRAGRARADHRRRVREGLDPRAARHTSTDLSGLAFKADDRLEVRVLRRDHVEAVWCSPPTAASTRSTRRSCRAGAATASRCACSSTWSRRPMSSRCSAISGGRKFLVASAAGPRLRRARGRMPRQYPQGQAGAQRRRRPTRRARSRPSRASSSRRSARTARCWCSRSSRCRR